MSERPNVCAFSLQHVTLKALERYRIDGTPIPVHGFPLYDVIRFDIDRLPAATDPKPADPPVVNA